MLTRVFRHTGTANNPSNSGDPSWHPDCTGESHQLARVQSGDQHNATGKPAAHSATVAGQMRNELVIYQALLLYHRVSRSTSAVYLSQLTCYNFPTTWKYHAGERKCLVCQLPQKAEHKIDIETL
jgi:hypothetical protein